MSKIGTKQMEEMTLAEYRRYKAKNLSSMEEGYLRELRILKKDLKEKSA